MKPGVRLPSFSVTIQISDQIACLYVKEQSLDFCGLQRSLFLCGFRKYLVQLICNLSVYF